VNLGGKLHTERYANHTTCCTEQYRQLHSNLSNIYLLQPNRPDRQEMRWSLTGDTGYGFRSYSDAALDRKAPPRTRPH
jgi:hypothetical protein